MVPRPPPDRPAKQCADCPLVLPDPRATRCPEHAAERLRDRRRTANAAYYGELRHLAAAGLAARDDGGAAWISREAGRRLAEAADALTEAVAHLDSVVYGAPRPGDPTGETWIRMARTHLRNQADAAAKLLHQVTQELAEHGVKGPPPPPPDPGAL